MKIKICFVLLILIMVLSSVCFAAITQDDFTLNGVNLVNSKYDDVIAKIGVPKKKTFDEQGEQPRTYLTYSGLQVWMDNKSGQLAYMKADGNDYQTTRGIKVGGTPYKIIKEYGEPQKQKIKGHLYYIYKMNPESAYRLVFDMTEGFVSKIILTSLPDNP